MFGNYITNTIDIFSFQRDVIALEGRLYITNTIIS